VLLVAVGCRGYHDEAELASWADEGRLCIVPADDIEVGLRPTPPDDVVLEAGVALAAAVLFSTCEECVSEPETGCSVRSTGALVDVTSSASYPVPREGVCGDGCDAVAATCAAGSYTAGTVTFEHGGELLPIEIPFTGYPCVGEPVPPAIGAR
jgi:hypothetical protein